MDSCQLQRDCFTLLHPAKKEGRGESPSSAARAVAPQRFVHAPTPIGYARKWRAYNTTQSESKGREGRQLLLYCTHTHTHTHIKLHYSLASASLSLSFFIASQMHRIDLNSLFFFFLPPYFMTSSWQRLLFIQGVEKQNPTKNI